MAKEKFLRAKNAYDQSIIDRALSAEGHGEGLDINEQRRKVVEYLARKGLAGNEAEEYLDLMTTPNLTAKELNQIFLTRAWVRRLLAPEEPPEMA